MRVASIESVLTAATLVSVIVVVLRGIKIFYGAWTSRKLASNKRPPTEEVRDEGITSAAAEAFCSNCRRIVRRAVFWSEFGSRPCAIFRARGKKYLEADARVFSRGASRPMISSSTATTRNLMRVQLSPLQISSRVAFALRCAAMTPP
jgi:hypothetical protein